MEKKGEISKISFTRKLDVCTLSDRKLKGKGEVMFVEGLAGCLAYGEEGQGKVWRCYHRVVSYREFIWT